MDSASRPRITHPWIDRGLTILLLIGAVGYAVFLARHLSPYAGGADSSGYLNSARLLEHGDFFAPVRLPPGEDHMAYGHMAFQPLGFIVDKHAPRMAPTYPLGLPLHLLAAARIGGWNHAVTIVNLCCALASGGVLWLLARQLKFSLAWSAIAVAMLWLCPLFIFCALQPMSDLPAVLWTLVVLYTALRGGAARSLPNVGPSLATRRSSPERGTSQATALQGTDEPLTETGIRPLRGRGNSWWCLACGMALSIAVLVRPTNALLIFPVILALGFRPLNYLVLGLGGGPGALLLGYYNYHVYGSALTTGYGSVESAFSASFLPHNLGHMALWIPLLLSPLVCAALAAPFIRGENRRGRLILFVSAALLAGFYGFYFHTGETWWYLRFILPAFPILLLGMIATLQKLSARLRRAPQLVLAGVIALAAIWEIEVSRRLHLTSIIDGEINYPIIAEWTKKHLPADSAIFSMQVSGALYFYSDFLLVRWDQIRSDRIGPLIEILQAKHHPIYAILYPFEVKNAQDRLGGEWEKIGEAGNSTIWQRKN